MRKRVRWFLVLAMALAAARLCAADDTVAYWRFEPGALLKDSSGNGRDVVPVGSGVAEGAPVAPATVPLTGSPNQAAAVFSGNGAVHIPNDGQSALGLKDGQDFTFECWLRTGKAVGTAVILSKVEDDPEARGARSHGFDFLTIADRDHGPAAPLHFRIYTRQDALIYLIQIADAIAPESSYHLALSRQGKTYRLFINGELRAEADCEETIAGAGDLFLGTLGIGNRPFGGHYLPGGVRMDEARFSGRALSPNEFLLFPRPGETLRRITLDAKEPAAGGLRRCAFPVIPGVYDVRLRFQELDPFVVRPGERVFDVAVNGVPALRKFDILAQGGAGGQRIEREVHGVVCPDGRLWLELFSHTRRAPLLNEIEIVAASGKLEQALMPAEAQPGSGWELPFPAGESLIPDPVKLQVTVSHEPNKPGPLRYVPSQNLAAFPDRLNPQTRSVVTGIEKLAPDVQEPIAGGVRFLPGKSGAFEIHHRRAGAQCGNAPVFALRMERFNGLATVGLAVADGGRFVRLDQFQRRAFEVLPGRVRYEMGHPEMKLAATVEAVAPAALPAYGLIARVALRDESGNARTVELVALAAAGRSLPSSPPQAPRGGEPFLRLDTPRGNPACDERAKNSPLLLLHDTAYSVLVGLDGDAAALGNEAVTRKIALPPGGEAEAYLTAFIDSPGFDEAAVRSRIGGYFDHNPDLPSEVRQRMTEEALDTYARIVVNGDAGFAKARSDGGAAFRACVAAWQTGLYRREPVRFELPDKKLESLANLAANDLFPGIVQPPGLVHDAKHGDTWNYIFCYRHVHAASDLGLEPVALDYMRLLSANQQKDGRISSVRANFLTPGHDTRFDASYIDSLHHYYKWTGDLEAVRQLWPTLTRAAEHIDVSLDPDGDGLYLDIIHQWKSDFDNRGPSSSFQTAIVRRAYADLAEFARLLDHPEAAEQYARKAERIRRAAQEQLWSDEMAMLGPKCPLGILRLHPQSLEVEMPVWTGLVDPCQAAMLTDWYLANVSFRDEQGGLWMYDNDWWPVVWSQHMGSPGDYMMVAWALLLTGRHEEGCRALQTVAAGSFRHGSPGFDFTFNLHGVQGGGDPATALGAFFRTIVEGLFGVRPELDKKRIVVHPRFPAAWDHARFQRPGLDLRWDRRGGSQSVAVRAAADVRVAVEVPVRSPVQRVLLDGQEVKPIVTPAMRYAVVSVETPPRGGTVSVETGEETCRIEAPTQARPGETVEVRLRGMDSFRVEDRFHFADAVAGAGDTVRFRLTRAACGRAAVFVHCRTGNVEWMEPVFLATLPATARDIQERTVLAPLPAGASYAPVDLSDAYTDDIQSCFRHKWKWDAYPNAGDVIRYWTMPLFDLRYPLPRRLRVGEVPFLLGPMGPNQAGKQKNLLVLANTPPRELPTSATIRLGGRRLHKVYLLSLNMNLPQKCYVPAAQVIVRYADGSRSATELVPPLNFDSFYQDFGVNTAALPLRVRVAYGQTPWVKYGGVNLEQHHLTMTDVLCDPAKGAESLEIRSIATETFFGLAGLTLAEAGR